jgi:predicted phage terminase large subunit-like protein
MLEAFPNARELRFKAIATEDEFDKETGELLRRKGEALFPEFKSLDFLLKQKAPMTQGGWESLYQQNPIIVGGGIFPVEKFGIPMGARPGKALVKKSVRYWDKAGTQGDGAFSAGVRIDWLKEGGFVVSDVKRGQWEYKQREDIIKQTTAMDNSEGWTCDVWIEQEPGSGGKESADRTIAMLAGYNAYKDKVKGDKELRAEPYAVQVQAGNVGIIEGKWNRDFLDEHETFPNGKYKDQVDAAGGAFAALTRKRIESPSTVSLPIYGGAS